MESAQMVYVPKTDANQSPRRDAAGRAAADNDRSLATTSEPEVDRGQRSPPTPGPLAGRLSGL